MAIQMRRGLKADFDAQKMLPGEWAVSTDTETENQIVWMCFAPGVVKRMGTYEDFMAQIQEISGDIINQFITQMTAAQEQLQGDTEAYIQGKVDDEWVPELKEIVTNAETVRNEVSNLADKAEGFSTSASESADRAEEKSLEASGSATAAEQSAQDAAESKKTAEDFSKMAESWAVGGTDTREGEDADNSKYYSGLSKASAEQAAIEAEKAAKYSAITAPNFMIDLEDMQLYMKDGVGVDFKLDDGALYWQLT